MQLLFTHLKFHMSESGGFHQPNSVQTLTIYGYGIFRICSQSMTNTYLKTNVATALNWWFPENGHIVPGEIEIIKIFVHVDGSRG
jgi:hypothetical protein